MQVDPPGPEDQETDYLTKAREATKREAAELRDRINKNREADQARRKKVDEELKAWETAVRSRDERRRNIGLTLAGAGVVAGFLLLLWASRLLLGSFPEKILDGLGTAMLVAATVEVAARIIRNQIRTHQRKVEQDRDQYLEQIRDDVIAIAAELRDESIEREATELDARDARNADHKALLEDARDSIMAAPSKTPAQEKILQSLNRMLASLRPVPDSYYYSAKADLQFDRKMEQLRRRLEGGKPDQTSGEAGEPDVG